jgi:hypothetical protein
MEIASRRTLEARERDKLEGVGPRKNLKKADAQRRLARSDEHAMSVKDKRVEERILVVGRRS